MLQPFPDGNHRTALIVVELFLRKNGVTFEISDSDAIKFEADLYALRDKIYHTYEEQTTQVLTEEKNEMYYYCQEFIKEHLT